jgi:hypothetical protein
VFPRARSRLYQTHRACNGTGRDRHLQTIMQDKKSGAAAKAALIAALATDPEARTGKLLLKVSKNPN